MTLAQDLFIKFVLRNPERVAWHLEKLHAHGRIDVRPNLWQVTMGVMYMLHRMVFRPATIGLDDSPVRKTWRARLWQYRPLRFPFLIWQKAIDPIDLTGLSGTMARKHSHLVGAYHPGDNALYDLECMTCDPEALKALRADVADILQNQSARAQFLKDLTVYEGYHERLLHLIDRALVGDFAPAQGQEDHPDTTLRGFLRWCAAQPETPDSTLRAFLQGEMHFGPSLANDNG